jgi:hypothetical protein
MRRLLACRGRSARIPDRAAPLLIGCTLALLAGCNGHLQKTDELRVTRAVLYQNGIGYFERQGTVDGDVIKLRIMPQQIADVLKSLTVVDLGSGRAINVALPVEKTRARQLAALPQQVREGGGLVGIAQAFRGARATVNATSGSGTGRLVGVEQLSEEKGGWRLTILGDDGTLQSFDLSQVHSLQLQDRTLEVGLRKALDVSLDEGSWKPVELSVHLAGETPHQLLVSYVVEMPTWKPAYRVVLSKDAKDGLLQGWAVVDNVSGEDWKKVRLSLTAGTPLTFTYDLYSPRFVRRPDLSPQQEAWAVAPPPPTGGAAAPEAEEKADRAEDKESLARDEDEAAGPMSSTGRGRAAERRRAPMKKARMKSYDRRPGASGEAAPSAPPPAEAPPAQMTSKMLEQSFRALVAGSRVGSLFRYDIGEPVTIKDRQSALVSILNKKVPAEDILLYRPDVSSANPYRAVRLTNTTGYIIEKGPVAIYRDANFVGEAVGGQVEAGTSAFIPYSVDGRVIISLADQVKDEGARLIKIHDGQLWIETKMVSLHKYTIYNQSGEEATLYVQREHRPGWKLTKPDKGVLVEKDNYFAPVKVASKGKTEFEVREETPTRRYVSLFSHEGQQAIALYLKDPSADPKVLAPLKEALALQEKLSKLEEELERLRREKNTYSERQSQVRENLKLLGKSVRNADLARKLTATLLELETKLNESTRNLVAKDMKRTEMRDRLTVLLKSVTLEAK